MKTKYRLMNLGQISHHCCLSFCSKKIRDLAQGKSQPFYLGQAVTGFQANWRLDVGPKFEGLLKEGERFL